MLVFSGPMIIINETTDISFFLKYRGWYIIKLIVIYSVPTVCHLPTTELKTAVSKMSFI